MRILIVGLCLAIVAPVDATESTNLAKPSRIVTTVNATYLSSRIPPANWKLVYDKPVAQSEIAVQVNTPEWKYLTWERLTFWVENPLEDEAFAAPAGEVNYSLLLGGPVLFGGLRTSFEVRFHDFAGNAGQKVWTFGDNDFIRLATRVDYPWKFAGGKHVVIPSLTWYHFIPVSWTRNSEGEVIIFQLHHEWKPLPWFKVGPNVGILHDFGIVADVPADVINCGIGAGVRLTTKFPEIWLNGGYQTYRVLGHPSNRPAHGYDYLWTGLSVKF